MKGIKNDLEFRQEKLEWESIYLRLRRMVEEKAKEDPGKWDLILEDLESSWRGIQEKLLVLYKEYKLT